MSISTLQTTPFTTKRPPALAGGKRGAPAVHLTASTLRCTPLDPADGEASRDIAVRLKDVLKAPYRILQTFVDRHLDIADGDILVVAGREYPVRQVNVWQWRATETYLQLMLEDSAA